MAIGMPNEEEIRSMADEGIVDPQVEEYLRAMQSKVSAELQAGSEFPTLARLDWLDDFEDTAAGFAEEIAAVGQDLRNGAAVLSARPGEAALVSELLSQAAWCGARRAEALTLVADARRLRDGYLRRMATTVDVQAELVGSAAIDFLDFVAWEMDGGRVPEADAARAEAMDAAARAGRGVGARFAAKFVGMAGRVRGRAGAYTGEVAAALRRRAAEVEALCADPEALVPRMLASGFWRLCMHQNRHAAGITPPTQSMPATPTPTPTPTPKLKDV